LNSSEKNLLDPNRKKKKEEFAGILNFVKAGSTLAILHCRRVLQLMRVQLPPRLFGPTHRQPLLTFTVKANFIYCVNVLEFGFNKLFLVFSTISAILLLLTMILCPLNLNLLNRKKAL
jgi:hypothetical protein